VETFLDSERPARYFAPARNYYLLRRNGESVGTKALIYTLTRGAGHHGHNALLGLLELGFPVHAKRRYSANMGKRFERFRELGALIFDNEDEDWQPEIEHPGPGKEGKLVLRYGSKYERSPRLRKLALQHHGLSCKACAFNFAKAYGQQLGAGYIEVHHLRPLSSVRGEHQIDPKTDLTVLCSNCHRMAHRRTGICLSVEALRRHLLTAKSR